MKIEELVCDLELSKKFKEFGINQKSFFYWEVLSDTAYSVSFDIKYMPYSCPGLERYSAFTSGELFELLPAFIDIKKNEPFNNFYLSLTKRSSENIRYIINYSCDTLQFDPGNEIFNSRLMKHNIYDENLSNCLAKMLIYLIENKIIDIKDLK